MIIRDQLGYYHDVPDSRLYGFQHVGYDGLGNPVGFPALLPLLSSLAPMASSLLPAVGDIVGGLFGGKKSAPPAPPPPPVVMAPPPPPPVVMEPLPPMRESCPPCPVCPVCGQPAEPPGALMPPPGTPRLMRVRRRRVIHARSR